MSLTFDQVSKANRERSLQWSYGKTEQWNGADWSNAMCGEEEIDVRTC